MEIGGSVAFVTGANRGLGEAYAEALLVAGAAKVYAGMRNVSACSNARLIPVKLDVTSPEDIAAASERCRDINILINNAGILLSSPILAQDSEAAMRREMEVNVYGLLNMSRTFAPTLARNGGGAIANMLSVASWFSSPFIATYCASKHAALTVSDALRIELKAQGTQVVGVYAGFIDTDMASHINQAKVSPRQVAERTLDGIRKGEDHVFADARSVEVWRALRADPVQFAAQMQLQWDQRRR